MCLYVGNINQRKIEMALIVQPPLPPSQQVQSGGLACCLLEWRLLRTDMVRRGSSWTTDGLLGSHLPSPERPEGIELCLEDIS